MKASVFVFDLLDKSRGSEFSHIEAVRALSREK